MSSINMVRDQLNIIAGQNLREKNYWTSWLSGAWEKAQFPYDHRVSLHPFIKQRKELHLPDELSAQLWNLSKGNNKALHVVLMSGVMTALWKYTGVADIIIGTPVYGQDAPVDSLINVLLPIRARFTADMSFRALLQSVRKTLKEAVEHQNYPLGVLAGQIGRSYSGNEDFSIFDVSVSIDQLHHEYYLDEIPHRLQFIFHPSPDHIQYEIVYHKESYTDKSIKCIADHFQRLLRVLLNELDKPLSDTCVVGSQERARMAEHLDRTEAKFPGDRSIQDIFYRMAEKFSAQTALTCRDENLSYRELDRRSSQVAHWLARNGVTRNSIVGVITERSPEMIIAVLGVLKAGGAYLPIDPDLPRQRIAYLLEDSGAQCLIIRDLLDTGVLFAGATLRIDSGEADSLPDDRPPVINDPGDLAYIIYTSGTTGHPKGVMITHKCVVRLLFNEFFPFSFGTNEVWTLFHNYNFDFSVWEMFGALLYGGRLVIVPKYTARDPQLLWQLLKEQKVTILNQTPSAFYLLSDHALSLSAAGTNLRYVIFGGEGLKLANLRNWAERYPQTLLVNMYGITETTVHVTFKLIGAEEIAAGTSNIGKPLPTLETLLFDKGGELVPVGAYGELHIGGEGLAIGYLNNPELSERQFIKHPFKEGRKLYKTGDIARLNADGDLEYLGRVDDQVQIRGYRIEPGEIENHLLMHEGIKDAIVLSHTLDDHAYLCAYWIGQQPLKTMEIRSFLEKRIPAYMVPTHFFEMNAFPLTKNNKIDKEAFPVVMRHDREAYVAPASPTEQEMIGIWQSALRIKDFGIRDNYFHIGGDSIRAIRLLSDINEHFKKNLRVIDLYTYDTVEKLSQKLDTMQLDAKEEKREKEIRQLEEFKNMVLRNSPMPVNSEIEDIFPMSDIQKGMTYYSETDRKAVVYHEQVVIEIKYEDLDLQRFLKALELMVDKHLIFRSCFRMEYYAHIVLRSVQHEVPYLDISGKELSGQKEHISRFLEEGKKNPFDLEKAPLWKMALFYLGGHYHVLVFELHHAILDGWSQASFFTEMNNTYLLLKEDPGYRPPVLKITYKEFILQEILNKKNEDTLRFWKKELEDYKRVDFLNPPGKERPSFLQKDEELGQAFCQALQQSAQKYGTSLKHLCFAAYAYTIHLLSYDRDWVAGLTTNTRPLATDGEQLVGCFLNTIPVRLRIPDNLTWAGYIAWIDRKLIELKGYDNVSLSEIMNMTGERSNEANPFFDTKFNFIDFHVIRELRSDRTDQDDRSVDLHNFIRENTLFDFHVNNTFQTLLLTMVYSPDVVSDEIAAKAVLYYKHLLNLFIYEPGGMASKNAFLPEDEKKKLFFDFNNTRKELPEGDSILDLYRELVSRSPHATALIYNDRVFTRDYVDLRTDRIAASIIRRQQNKVTGVIPIVLQRGPDLVMAIIGIMKSGNAYLPVDPTHPASRIQYILGDAGGQLVVTSGEWIELLARDTEWIDIGNDEIPTDTERPAALPAIRRTDAAYVIYTSGSTGFPKGVIIGHDSLLNRLKWMGEHYQVSVTDTILQKTPSIFDVSVWELCLWMITGSRLCILKAGEEKDPDAILNVILRNRISLLHFVPSMLSYFVEVVGERKTILRSVRQLFTSGEALEVRHAERMRDLSNLLPGRLANLYGPTEASIDVTSYDIGEELPPAIPIGYPIDNTQIYILDSMLEIQPAGAEGELCIAGIGVGRGYLNRPELTGDKFIKHPELKTLLYRTGDRARWDEAGRLIYRGRKDDQVKIRGIRVELGEIESELRKLPYIKEAVVIADKDSSGDSSIYAYFVSLERVPVQAIKEQLTDVLPVYMVPSFILQVGMIPITQNGKLDKKALLSLEIEAGQDRSFELPETDMEKTVADIWKEVLHVGEIGLDDQLFEIGGDSFKSLQIWLKLKSAVNGQIHIKDIFMYPTIRSLAHFLQLKG